MAINPSSTKLLVTGANGFIGLHTVLHFLQRDYNLRATLRTEGQEKKVRQTLAKHVDTNKLEFISADLTKDEGRVWCKNLCFMNLLVS
jgi:nucleoside-diphosphate-sugar epimerase